MKCATITGASLRLPTTYTSAKAVPSVPVAIISSEKKPRLRRNQGGLPRSKGTTGNHRMPPGHQEKERSVSFDLPADWNRHPSPPAASQLMAHNESALTRGRPQARALRPSGAAPVIIRHRISYVDKPVIGAAKRSRRKGRPPRKHPQPRRRAINRRTWERPRQAERLPRPNSQARPTPTRLGPAELQGNDRETPRLDRRAPDAD